MDSIKAENTNRYRAFKVFTQDQALRCKESSEGGQIRLNKPYMSRAEIVKHRAETSAGNFPRPNYPGLVNFGSVPGPQHWQPSPPGIVHLVASIESLASIPDSSIRSTGLRLWNLMI
jgi:hypothetical protein